MNLATAAAIVVVVATVAIGAMLLVRRRAPEGSYFADGDRASAVFGVVSTGFAIFVGFVIFLAFESYDVTRTGANVEASSIVQQFETTQSLPAAVRAPLSAELICYARTVVHQEWPRMQGGGLDAELNPWGLAMFRTLQPVEPKTNAEQAAYASLLDQRSARETARLDRVRGTAAVIPVPLWIVLFLSAGVIFSFMLLFADSGERAFVQAMMMGGVAVIITSTVLLLGFLNNPYGEGVGGLRPVAMERSLKLLALASTAVGDTGPTPCDEQGFRRATP